MPLSVFHSAFGILIVTTTTPIEPLIITNLCIHFMRRILKRLLRLFCVEKWNSRNGNFMNLFNVLASTVQRFTDVIIPLRDIYWTGGVVNSLISFIYIYIYCGLSLQLIIFINSSCHNCQNRSDMNGHHTTQQALKWNLPKRGAIIAEVNPLAYSYAQYSYWLLFNGTIKEK